ncbi:hypothetical protein FRC10_004365 [Ceratobasidium sp. 414]|nr:hypothetical protein FRC10_004365 [Ceratobasidium sp. 414]
MRSANIERISGEFPFAVKEELIVRTIDSWRMPVEEVFDRAQNIFFERVTALVDKHFGNHAYGGLRAMVMKIVVEKLEELKTATNEELKFLLKMESLPFTLNSHYYLDYREKFLAHYKYFSGAQNAQVRKLREPPRSTSPPSNPRPGGVYNAFTATAPEPVDHVEEALKSLRLAGLHGLKREDMVKLLPVDFSQEAALEIMASVRAYYQDTVPLAIDQRFVHAFDKAISVTLVAGLSISAPDARERCAAWLAESQAVVRQRAELLDRKARLAAAKKELLEVPGVSAMRDTMAKATNRAGRERTRRSTASAMPGSVPVTPATVSASTFVVEEVVVAQEVVKDYLGPMVEDVPKSPFSRFPSVGNSQVT